MKIYIVTPAGDDNRAYLLKNLPMGYSVVFGEDLPEATRFEAFASADIVMGNVPLEWLERANSHIKWWQLESTGFHQYERFKPDFLTTNVGDYYAQPCAETIVGGVLALYRRIDTLVTLQKTTKWLGKELRLEMKLLSGQHVVLLGAGAIGLAVRNILWGFGCHITLVAKTNPAADITSTTALKAILPKTDLVISCLPGTAEGFFDEEMIGLLPKTAVFANVGRGNTVDERALIKALQNALIEGAVLDVTATEPLPPENPLWALPNVLILQHTGGGRRNEHGGKFELFLDNLIHFETGTPLNNTIDLSRGY